MASVERAMAKAAAALLPGLLPTPPRSMATPCMIILPSSFASKQPKPGRADSVERWDAHKKPKSPASSIERWDVNKKIPGGSTSSSSSSRGSSSRSCEKWNRSKRSPSRASSADRWDAHKKARSPQSDAQSCTEERDISDKGSQEGETTAMEILAAPRMDPGMFSGSSCFASPEPSMLPMPAFFSSRGHGMMAVPAH